MLRRHRSTVEWLPHDVVELILERLPVKSLLRFKCVSKKWKITIESSSFKEEQMIRRRLSRGPDVLFVRLLNTLAVNGDDAQRFVFGSSEAYTVSLPTTGLTICHGSCDGLVCLYNVHIESMNVVVNPATGWHQSFPISNIHRLVADWATKRRFGTHLPDLGFGKDKFTGTYKPVWLYNSSEYGLENVTTCEVFDFCTNAWRYVVPASPYRILEFQNPVHFDGCLHWLAEGEEETNVLSFDLHTETFQVISKAPFPHAPYPRHVTMCILDNRLCVSLKNLPTQVIWWFESSSGTWKEMCSIDITKTFSWFRWEPEFVLSPIAILDKNKLLLQGREYNDPVLIHDLDTKSCDLLFKPVHDPVGPVYYFETLLSVSMKKI